PLLLNAKRLVETGAASPGDLRVIFKKAQARIDELMDESARRPKLTSVEQVVEPLAPYAESASRGRADHVGTPEGRGNLLEGARSENAKEPNKRTMAAHINSAIADEMLRFPEIVVFGEDVAKKGGVYYVTQGLQKKFGVARVFDTLLDETTIFGTAQGAAMAGLLPIPEIQYLAYIHNALDQIRGEACSLSFFSSG